MTDTLEKHLLRSRRIFQFGVVLSVIVLSFAYGLSAGLSKRIDTATALSIPEAPIMDDAMNSSLSNSLGLPSGLALVPIGREIAINGKDAQAVMFYSNKPVGQIVDEQTAIWKSRGVTAFSKASWKRGVAIGVDRGSGDKYSMVAWMIPPSVRKLVSPEHAVQGFVTISNGARGLARIDESSGKIPGIPLMPGAKAGAIFSSAEHGGRSLTGAYSSSATLEESMSFYRTELVSSGWKEEDGGSRTDKAGFLKFSREGETADLLFSADQGASRTTVLVTVSVR